MKSIFIKLKKNQEVIDLIETRPSAFNLLCLIALRARRTFNKANGLQVGEAYVGDYKKYGVSRQVYRNDIKLLKSTNYITTKSTNKGTIAKLNNTAIFDINTNFSNHQINQLANQTATIKEPLTKNANKESYSNAVEQPLNNSDKKKAWDTYSTIPLKDSGIKNPVWISECRNEFLTKSKYATERAVAGFIRSKLLRQKPDPNLVTDVWDVPPMEVKNES